jgi:3-oxoacyl-[acyl-carrier-protein] synthase II
MNRVLVTGIGVVSPVGTGREQFWSNLAAGRSGIGPITLFDASAFPVRIGGEVRDFDAAAVAAQFPEAADLRDRKVLLALAAAQQAIADSRLTDGDLRHALLCMGVGLEAICLEDLMPYAEASDLERTMAGNLASPGDRWLQTPLSQTTTILGNRYGLLAGRFTNCSACAAGTQVVGEAWQMLGTCSAERNPVPQHCLFQAAAHRGGEYGQTSPGDRDLNVALVGAADSMINPLGLGGFSLLRVLSTENDSPQTACRPFDLTRQGTVLGEGAAFLVLERAGHAAARGAPVYAEVIGYGSSLDAFAVSDPDPSGRGAVDSMRRAMRTAGLGPDDIDCVSAHGTGTPKNDAIETAAVKEVLGWRAYEIPVHSVKSMTGHLIAASGAVAAVAAALTLARGIVPPTTNLRRPDPQCDLDYVPGAARAFAGKTVLSNSFGFGGQNATIILAKTT